MRRWIRRGLTFALSLGLIYASVVGAALWWRHDLIYPFDPTPFEPQHVGLPRADVVELPNGPTIWRVEPYLGKPVILYFMGNVGNLGRNGPRIQEFALRGYGLIAMTYRGGGGVAGTPTETILKADALRVWNAAGNLAPGSERVIYGASLGSGLATWLATEVDGELGVILETPFTRLCDAIHNAMPLPACTVMWDERYDSLDLIDRIGSPLLVMHGTADRIIPFDQGQRLFDAAGQPKTFIEYPGGRHNDLRLYGAGIDALAWIDALPVN